MSDLLNSASLVLIPSGYKEDIVYSAVPTDGSGDLSFTRASNGTRVNSAGLVEVVPWNFIQYSEDFTNAVWSAGDISITSNATTAPNGTTTADKIIAPATSNSHGIENSGYLSLIVGSTCTTSFYAKASGYNFIQWLASGGNVSGNPRANFNLSNGTLGSVDTGLTASIESVGNGWYRCVVSFVVANNIFTNGFYISDSSTASRPPIFTGNGTDGVFVWGAQTNIGSTAKPYFPTTDRLNVPRLTYQNGGGGCPSLLLEKQSTNTIVNSIWSGGGTTPTSWAKQFTGTTSPVASIKCNDVSAYNFNAVALRGFFSQGQTFTNGTTYAFSIYVESVSVANTIGSILTIANASGTSTYLKNNVSISSSENIVAGNNYTLIFVATATSTGEVRVGIGTSGTSNTGNFTLSMPQLEASSYPTSYINTTSASATRVADACFKTGISSLIGTDFTIFFDGIESTGGDYSRYIVLKGTGGIYVNYIALEGSPNNAIAANVNSSGGLSVFSSTSGSFTNGQRIKMALRCKNNDFAFYINGSLISSQASGSVPTTADLYLGYYVDYTDNYNKVNQVAIFNQTLTNAELASLTTL